MSTSDDGITRHGKSRANVTCWLAASWLLAGFVRAALAFKQVVHRAMLMLADDRDAVQPDGEHCDVIDYADDAHEPASRGVSIERQVDRRFHRVRGHVIRARYVAKDCGLNDLLHVALKVWRNVHDGRVTRPIKQPVDILRDDFSAGLK